MDEKAMALAPLSTRYHKVIRDSVHGDIYVDPLSLKFMDSRGIQRLRGIKQLGCCSFVYASANHTRFEHSLGVYHLARQTVKNLYTNYPELEIDRDDIQAVSLAGMLHDVGHGPFSHAFENEFLSRVLKNGKWSHEEMSIKMIDYIVDDNYIDIDNDLLKRVKDMILCSKDPSLRNGRPKAFLFDIVANGLNSVDVDKYDYISRDGKACGVACNEPFQRFKEGIRVIDDEICYRAKDAKEIWNLFDTRHDLFKKIYVHQKVKAAELMLADVLLAADEYMGVSAAVHDAETFTMLTDGILECIQNCDLEELKKARVLATRMQRVGDGMYKFINECQIPLEKLDRFKQIRPADIVCYAKNGAKLSEEDVIVSIVKFDKACGKKHPLDGVHFYNDIDDSGKFTILPEQLCLESRQSWMEATLRIYSRKEEHVGAIADAFLAFQKDKLGGPAQLHDTPDRKRRHSSSTR